MEEQKQTRGTKKENFNPLKKEVVEVKFIKSTSKMYSNSDSPLPGVLPPCAGLFLCALARSSSSPLLFQRFYFLIM